MDIKPQASITTLDSREHVLKVPDMYIGAAFGEQTVSLYVWNEETKKMEHRDERVIIPAVLKLFDEALVNAADHCKRGGATELSVMINPLKNEITVTNNGRMIPLALSDKIKSLADPSQFAYNWEQAFFRPMTSSNFERADRTIGSRFGLGVKITSILSSHSTLFVCDGKHKYTQKSHQNMSVVDKPRVQLINDSKKEEEPELKFTFSPDWDRLAPGKSVADAYAMMLPIFRTRVIELAGSLPLTLSSSGPSSETKPAIRLFYGEEGSKVKLIKPRGFKDFVKSFDETISIYETEDKNPSHPWSVGICSYVGPSSTSVNHIRTYQGGTHEEFIRRQIHDVVKQKYPDMDTFKLSGFYTLVINATIDDPKFKSQSKECMVTPSKDFAAHCRLAPEWIMKQLDKFKIKERIEDYLRGKKEKAANKEVKSSDKFQDIKHFTDAEWAGTKHSGQAHLFLTEGVSASALVETGRSIIGDQAVGILAMRGVGINADRSDDAIQKDEAVTHIRRILGLKLGKDVQQKPSDLRYGHVVIMADQDKDGSHIIGLLIFLFKRYWPSLLQTPGFLSIFITPIITIRRLGNIHRMFFTIPEYEHWLKQEPPRPDKYYHTKYYKGLGTSTNKEAVVYFRDFARHLKPFHPVTDQDNLTLEMAFSKTQANARKEWLKAYDPNVYLPYTDLPQISAGDFINRCMIHFSWLSIHRAIPLIEDGMTPAQRKCLWTLMELKVDAMENEEKLASLQGKIASSTQYAHGADSLSSTMISMAQVYTGANNIALLVPSGQFGTRSDFGYSTAASPRYINTYLSPLVPKIFRPEDKPLLKLGVEEGKPIEPVAFAPIIPMALVNESSNIGTGWCTRVPAFKPEDLIQRLKHRLSGLDAKQPWVPYYENYAGSLTLNEKGTIMLVEGKVEQISENLFHVTDIPLHTSIEKYKSLMEATDGVSAVHVDNSGNKLLITVKTTKPIVGWRLKENWTLQLNLLGLQSDRQTEKIMTLQSLDEIFDHFFQYRYYVYQERLEYQRKALWEKIRDREHRVTFVRAIVSGTLVVFNRPWTEVEGQMIQLGIPADYHEPLTNMNIRSLTQDRIQQLERELEKLREQLNDLMSTTVEHVWLAELDELEEALPSYWALRREWAEIGDDHSKTASSASHVPTKKRTTDTARPQIKKVKA